jgi:hypothetical protein
MGGIALITFKQFRRVVLTSLILAGVAATNAQADELPMRKSGFWQITLSTGVKGNNLIESPKIHQCVDDAPETLRKYAEQMQKANKACPKIDARKTATGYVIDAECAIAKMSTQVAGDFETTYTLDQTATITNPMTNNVIYTVTKGKGKWLGACPTGWKAGDFQIPGNHKVEDSPVGTVGHILTMSLLIAVLHLYAEDNK